MQVSTEYMEDRDRIKELFFEQISGIIDEEGKAELEAFGQKGPQEEAFLKGLEKESARIGLYGFAERIQPSEDWQKISPKRAAAYPWKWISIAASFLLLCSIGGYRLLNNPSSSIQAPQAAFADSGEITLETSEGQTLRVEGRRLEYPENGKEAISMHTLSVPRKKEYELVLADGTKVWMNADSKLIYPSRFSGGKREVHLEGEAFFEVSASEQEPFLVHVAGRQIQVLGTTFFIEAYDPDRVTTSLLEGKVRLNSDAGTLLLLPGERGSAQAVAKRNVLTGAAVLLR